MCAENEGRSDAHLTGNRGNSHVQKMTVISGVWCVYAAMLQCCNAVYAGDKLGGER